MNAFIVVDIVKRCAEVGHHERVGGKNGSRSGRGSVNGKEGANCGELAANFFFLNVEETSDVLNHLLMGKGQFIAGGTVWRRRGNNVGGIASTIDGRGGARWDKDGRRQARHRWNSWTVVWCVEGKKLVCMVNTKRAVNWRGFCEVLESQSEVGMRIF